MGKNKSIDKKYVTQKHSHTHTHTYTHTYTDTHTSTHKHTNPITPRCSGGVASGLPRDGRCVQTVRALGERSLLRYLIGAGTAKLWLAAYPATRRRPVYRKGKTEGRNSYGRFDKDYTVSCPYSRRVRKPVERCCSCTRNSTCSTMSQSTMACECQNAVRQCTGFYCWGWCKNQGLIMTSPAMARCILGHLPRDIDPPAAY